MDETKPKLTATQEIISEIRTSRTTTDVKPTTDPTPEKPLPAILTYRALKLSEKQKEVLDILPGKRIMSADLVSEPNSRHGVLITLDSGRKYILGTAGGKEMLFIGEVL